MKRAHKQAVIGILLIVTAAGLFLRAMDKDRSSALSPAARLLGPLASLASDLTWFSAQSAISAGEHERAVVLAERAVKLAPRSSLGWERYALLMGTMLASPETEPDPALRLAWLRAALAVYKRGEAVSDDPGQLALARAVLLISRIDVDPDLPWPGGPAEPWELAAEAFDRAAHWNADPSAREFASHARDAAREQGN